MHAAANWYPGSLNRPVAALHLLLVHSSVCNLTWIGYSNIMQRLIEQLNIITDNTMETFVITNNKSAVSVSLDRTLWSMLWWLSDIGILPPNVCYKSSLSAFPQDTLTYLCNQLSFNELQLGTCVYPFPWPSLSPPHHPAIRNYHILLCKHHKITHTAD